jgi:hypothetical protein
LPILPNNLIKLDCSINLYLAELPELPESLIVIICNNCSITELPILPIRLKKLYCHTNNINELPELPISLKTFFCNTNNIKYLTPHNCEIIKNIGLMDFSILRNPISDGFDCNRKFKKSIEKTN